MKKIITGSLVAFLAVTWFFAMMGVYGVKIMQVLSMSILMLLNLHTLPQKMLPKLQL